jgi:hypothetical protein
MADIFMLATAILGFHRQVVSFQLVYIGNAVADELLPPSAWTSAKIQPNTYQSSFSHDARARLVRRQ